MDHSLPCHQAFLQMRLLQAIRMERPIVLCQVAWTSRGKALCDAERREKDFVARGFGRWGEDLVPRSFPRGFIALQPVHGERREVPGKPLGTQVTPSLCRPVGTQIASCLSKPEESWVV